MSKFVHLHTHSHYSLLEALPKVPDLVERAKKYEMSALALTDSGNLYGAIEFYKECLDNKIKPIIGIDAYVALRTRHDKEARIDNTRSRLILLAQNEAGYKNLLKIVTASNLEGFYYKPRIDKELLEQNFEGLIVIMPSFSGGVVKALSSGDKEKAKNIIEWYKNVFGNEKFFLEITHHPEIGGHEEKQKNLIDFARETDTKIVAAHDVYYLDPEDRQARETVMSIQSNLGGGNNSGNFGGDEEDDFSFISEKEAIKRFKNTPDAIENTIKIAEMCDLKLELGKWVFPNLEIPDKVTPDDALRKIVYDGIERRNLEKTDEVITRIEYELKIIKEKGYPKYFLVVSDLLHFAHKNGILTNIRGSVAGSLVTYLAGITNINPLEFKLPFERFLNPDRPSAPDIDMDFADNRRDEVIAYARDKYGSDHVAQIGTFGTMMARGAVRDVARAMGYPYATGDIIAKMIPMGAQGFPMTLTRAMKENPDLKKLYAEDVDTRTVIDMAKKIEGNARHISVHAAGVVLSPTTMTDYTPLQYDTKGEMKIITQYDMYSIEEAGLLKFDFLGIRNLAIIADAIERIKKIEGVELNFETIPIDDKKTFEMLARGETEGTFQMNGDGMTKALMDLKPTNIHDINVMVALYRPGPMDNIQEYIARKHSKKPIVYMHPKMKDFLDTTFGVLVYQDDLLMTAIEVAGYTWGEVDKFRKAVGKKIPAEMAKQHIIFVEGCQKHGGLSKEKAEAIWQLFEPFQGYGFNKAHAASYGHIAYITAYLKANFPAIYMSAVLSAESGDVDTIGIMVNECKRMGIEVLPPSVNESYSQFTVVADKDTENLQGSTLSEITRSNLVQHRIRFGLTTIKNFGQGISTAIIDERKRNGKFLTLTDFLTRVVDKNLNKKSLEALIKSGAMDEFGERGHLLGNLELLLGYHKEVTNVPKNQDSLFGLMTDATTVPTLRLIDYPEASKKDVLLWEKELLGLYISGHPLEAHQEKLSRLKGTLATIEQCPDKEPCVVAGIVTDIREVMTKKGDRMVFIKIEDFSGSIDAVVFPTIYEEFKKFIEKDNCIAIKGKVSKRNGETSVMVDKIKAL